MHFDIVKVAPVCAYQNLNQRSRKLRLFATFWPEGFKEEGENRRSWFCTGADVSEMERASERAAKKREEGCGNISSCCTGSSGPIDVSTACTRALSTSYQHRWAARSVLQQEKIHNNCKALVVLPPTHFSQTLTSSQSFLTSETIPWLGFVKSGSGKTKEIKFV